MANLSLNLSITWKNLDEFQRLTKNVAEAQRAFHEAVKELSEFVPDVNIINNNKER